MRKSSAIIVLSFLLVALYSCSQHQNLSPALLEELNTAEKAMFDATTAGDSVAFRKICGTDYFTINANGESHTLEETIPAVYRFKGSSAVLSEQKQRVFGDVAIRNGRAKILIGDQQVAEILYTSGWIYRDKHWQFIHWQGTLAGMSLAPLQGTQIEPPK